MKHILVLRCEHGHEQRIEHDERYSRDVVRAFGVFYAGGSALGITGSDGEPLVWPEGACRVGRPNSVAGACRGALSFEIEEVSGG